MNIGRQWEDRLRIWAEQFPKHYFRKAASLSLEYFTTFDHIAFEAASKMAYSAAPAGAKWGKKWEYGWFRTAFAVPAELEGKRLVLHLECGE